MNEKGLLLVWVRLRAQRLPCYTVVGIPVSYVQVLLTNQVVARY